MTTVLPPGNILQNLYLKRRLKEFPKQRRFLEIGSGNGYISNLLLSTGRFGTGIDLNASACLNNEHLNKEHVSKNLYRIHNDDFFNFQDEQQFDIIISCMVIEHLPDQLLFKFIEKCKTHLAPHGCIIFYVPSSMDHWGIEDGIAGHIKRYEHHDLLEIESKHNLNLVHYSGLTYPLSNWLFTISNRLITKHETEKLDKNQLDKTIDTGNRNVPYKTNFPFYFKVLLNEYTLLPFHWLQLMFRKNQKAMVMYAEFKFLRS